MRDLTPQEFAALLARLDKLAESGQGNVQDIATTVIVLHHKAHLQEGTISDLQNKIRLLAGGNSELEKKCK